MFDYSKLETFLEFHLKITISEDIVYQTMKYKEANSSYITTPKNYIKEQNLIN